MKITSKKNGPNVLMFDKAKKIIIKKGDSVEEKELQVIAFCRCGHSKNMPFCDGTHKEVNFNADEAEVEIQE